jgi:hypothetical protein
MRPVEDMLDELRAEADALLEEDPAHFEEPTYPNPGGLWINMAAELLGFESEEETPDVPWHHVLHVAWALRRQDEEES